MMPSDIIYCALSPDITRGPALKYPTAIAADKGFKPISALKSRTKLRLNFVWPSSASFSGILAQKAMYSNPGNG
jgi:hypothetical protein